MPILPAARSWCFHPPIVAVAATALLVALPSISTGQTNSGTAQDLGGLWQAKLRFGPDIRGTLLVEHRTQGWRAEISGRSTEPTVDKDLVVFALPDERGDYYTQLQAAFQMRAVSGETESFR
jgi:hypothetical protein